MHKITKKLVAEFYRLRGGTEPVREWLLELDITSRKIIGSDIMKIELFWPIGMPVCRPLGNGLYEVRSNTADNKICRIFFCIKDNRMILLHSFIKKSQKTPDKEIDLALKRKKEVLSNDQN